MITLATAGRPRTWFVPRASKTASTSNRRGRTNVSLSRQASSSIPSSSSGDAAPAGMTDARRGERWDFGERILPHLSACIWSSGTVSQPSRAITKEGPAVLRLAFFQAANAARRQDPQLAGFYHRLMTEHGHCHTQACVAVARKLVERTWTVLTRGTPYQLRDPDGQPSRHLGAKRVIKNNYTVPDHVRASARA